MLENIIIKGASLLGGGRMFIKIRAIEAALERSKQFSLFFLCRVLNSGLFFEQFYSWLPLYKILKISFPAELSKYEREINGVIMTYEGSQNDKLIHGISNPQLRDKLLRQRTGDNQGWGIEAVDLFPNFSFTVQVLIALLGIERQSFFKTDVFKISVEWICNRWKYDFYEKSGLAFKGAIFLRLLREIVLAGGNVQTFIDQSIIMDTLKYIEETQTKSGSWGFFFRDFKGVNLDEKLETPLMASVVCLNLLASQSIFQDLYPDNRLEKIINRSVEYLIRNQHKEGFWVAISLDNFLKTLGWTIKFLCQYLKK